MAISTKLRGDAGILQRPGELLSLPATTSALASSGSIQLPASSRIWRLRLPDAQERPGPAWCGDEEAGPDDDARAIDMARTESGVRQKAAWNELSLRQSGTAGRPGRGGGGG